MNEPAFPHLIAQVEAAEPGVEVVTLSDWMRWREAETERMKREIVAQFAAYLDHAFGETVH